MQSQTNNYVLWYKVNTVSYSKNPDRHLKSLVRLHICTSGGVAVVVWISYFALFVWFVNK